MEQVLLLFLLFYCISAILFFRLCIDNYKSVKQLCEDDLKTNESLRKYMEFHIECQEAQVELLECICHSVQSLKKVNE